MGEILGLQSRDIDFDRNEILVRRVQENDGATFDATKTEAGMRTFPMEATLRQMLLDWRERCPRLDGALFGLFRMRGKRQPWPKPRLGGRRAAALFELPGAGLEAVSDGAGVA